MICEPTRTPADVDIAALKERYNRERDKRRRPEGERQYVEASEDFSDFYEVDPYSPPIERDPISEDLDVAVLGGGFAGLLTAARVKEAGIDDIRIIEMGGDFGGTWYWNRYPGVQCDIESYCYVPLLEEVGYLTKHRYSYGAEIFEQCQRIGRHFGLYEKALFGTMVRSLRWDASINRWRVSTNRGDELRARFLIMASGPYNRPKLPGIPGINEFTGHSFHTSRWDYEYTGGDTTGGLHKLADKRVAIIGTGATAPCYVSGTRIPTDRGEVAVEHLWTMRFDGAVAGTNSSDTETAHTTVGRVIACRCRPAPGSWSSICMFANTNWRLSLAGERCLPPGIDKRRIPGS